MYTHNIHSVFSVFHMGRVLVLYIIAYDNTCSNPAVHVVLCEDNKIEIKETEFYHRNFYNFVHHIILFLKMIL